MVVSGSGEVYILSGDRTYVLKILLTNVMRSGVLKIVVVLSLSSL